MTLSHRSVVEDVRRLDDEARNESHPEHDAGHGDHLPPHDEPMERGRGQTTKRGPRVGEMFRNEVDQSGRRERERE